MFDCAIRFAVWDGAANKARMDARVKEYDRKIGIYKNKLERMPGETEK